MVVLAADPFDLPAIKVVPDGDGQDLVGDVVLDRGHLLGARILGPDALRAAKVRDARGGGDAGTGEHHATVDVTQVLGSLVD